MADFGFKMIIHELIIEVSYCNIDGICAVPFPSLKKSRVIDMRVFGSIFT